MNTKHAYYTYLISSLPMLSFGAKAPFSFEKFVEICESSLPESDLGVIKKTKDQHNHQIYETQETFKKWHAFDTALRNEIVKIRAKRKKIDPLKYIRDTKCGDFSVMHIAMSAHRDPSILEGEKGLDRERWRFLDELSMGHYFDLDHLIIYAYKLQILRRWEEITQTVRATALEKILKKS